jgi:hypothetical protein
MERELEKINKGCVEIKLLSFQTTIRSLVVISCTVFFFFFFFKYEFFIQLERIQT